MRHEPVRHGSPPARHSGTGKSEAFEIRRLSRPFWATILISAISLMVFVSFLSYTLDRNSIDSSEKIFSAMFGDRTEHLSDITLEYGFWTDSVENLVPKPNMDWVRETFVDYMQAELQIEGVHILNGEGAPTLHVVSDVVVDADLKALYGRSFDELVATARQTRRNAPPVPAAGLIGKISELYLACAVLITGHQEDTYNSTEHVLVFAQPIGEDALAELSVKYGLPGLDLSEDPPGFWQAGFEIRSIGGQSLGHFVWNPVLAGHRILPLLGAGVLLVFACMYLSARLFFQRASETVHELETAKLEAEKARELLASQALSDPLTGLGNRRMLDDSIANLQQQQPLPGGNALLYVDLDRFKDVNDTYGHETGDLVLQFVADALRSLAQPDDTVIRLGGDEFVIVFGSAKRERVLSAGRAIVEQLSRPVKLDGATYSLGASVGIAFSNNPSELLRQADVALYSAKRRGKGQVSIYSAGLFDFREAPIPTGAKQ